jgi:hypothetical protein
MKLMLFLGLFASFFACSCPCFADSTSSNLPKILRATNLSEFSKGVEISTNYSWVDETEFIPEIDANAYRWLERSITVQITKSTGSGRFGFGYTEGTIKQENELYNDTDFALDRTAPFILADWQFSPQISAHTRVRFESFSNDGNSGFYQLDEDKELWTGYGSLRFTDNDWWLNFSYARNRDPEPIYDAINDRVDLDISAQELVGMTIGKMWTEQWESALGLYYEAYGSTRPDQLNYTAEVTHKPLWLSGLQAALGVGYYTEEQDTLVNLCVRYQKQLNSNLTCQIEYQLEYSDDEQSLLNQGQLIVHYKITRHLTAQASVEYSQETGDDEDKSLYALAQLSYQMF